MPENKEKEEEKPIVAKTATDLQRLKLQKLMKNPVNMSKWLTKILSCFSHLCILAIDRDQNLTNNILQYILRRFKNYSYIQIMKKVSTNFSGSRG